MLYKCRKKQRKKGTEYSHNVVQVPMKMEGCSRVISEELDANCHNQLLASNEWNATSTPTYTYSLLLSYNQVKSPTNALCQQKRRTEIWLVQRTHTHTLSNEQTWICSHVSGQTSNIMRRYKTRQQGNHRKTNMKVQYAFLMDIYQNSGKIKVNFTPFSILVYLKALFILLF